MTPWGPHPWAAASVQEPDSYLGASPRVTATTLAVREHGGKQDPSADERRGSSLVHAHGSNWTDFRNPKIQGQLASGHCHLRNAGCDRALVWAADGRETATLPLVRGSRPTRPPEPVPLGHRDRREEAQQNPGSP